MTNVTSPLRLFLMRWAKILQRDPAKKSQVQRPQGDLMEELHYHQCQEVALKIDRDCMASLKAINEGKEPNAYPFSPEVQARLDAGEHVPIADILNALSPDQQEKFKADMLESPLRGSST